MHLYLLAKLLTCVASAIFGTIILMRDSRHLSNRLSAAALYGCSLDVRVGARE